MRGLLLAARIAAHASAGQVLVSQRVTEAVPPGGVVFREAGEAELKGVCPSGAAAGGLPGVNVDASASPREALRLQQTNLALGGGKDNDEVE
jgi:hypothetical protein